MSSDLQIISGCPAIDQLIETSTTYDGDFVSYRQLEWIPGSEITDVKLFRQSADLTIYYAVYGKAEAMLLLLGSRDKCTNEFINEFARIHSFSAQTLLPPNVDQFERYPYLLAMRNACEIQGFTMIEDTYYFVADKRFAHFYSLYGFCSACGLLRCSPVWCICGQKELSNGWTSNCKKLDDFIRESQIQTETANDFHLQFAPSDLLALTLPEKLGFRNEHDTHRYTFARYRRTSVSVFTELIPLETSDLSDDQFYQKLCSDYPDILDKHVNIVFGFTYDPLQQKYALVKSKFPTCRFCTGQLCHYITHFCFLCKRLIYSNWTTGNKSLDLFLMKSWQNMIHIYDGYLQWIDFSQLKNVHEMSSFDHGCSQVADWIRPSAKRDRSIKVVLKKIVDGEDAQSYDFNLLVKEYPKILTPDNIWIIGITQEPSKKDYFLIFYSDAHSILDNIVQIAKEDFRGGFVWMQYEDFYDIEETASGGYGTVYAAKTKSIKDHSTQLVALKRMKDFDQTFEAFVSEIKMNITCDYDNFLQIYGITQVPEKNEYMLVMQYAEGGNLLSYLVQNINKLTWRMKAELVKYIAFNLEVIHSRGLIHCDLHGGNVLLDRSSASVSSSTSTGFTSYICDLGLSQSVHSYKPNSQTIQGVLPYIAPEVFHTHKHTSKSDIYAFGILMHQIASGEPPFRDRAFDYELIQDICNGLRPYMPDSAPEPFKEIAKQCCDAEPDNRPNAEKIKREVQKLFPHHNSSQEQSAIWDTIYKKENINPVSHIEKEVKYSSKILTMEYLPTPRNSYISDSKQIELVLPDKLDI